MEHCPKGRVIFPGQKQFLHLLDVLNASISELKVTGNVILKKATPFRGDF